MPRDIDFYDEFGIGWGVFGGDAGGGRKESSALLSSRIYKDATVCKPRAHSYVSVKRDTFSKVESRV